MSPIQQMLLGVGAKDDPIYVDDVFSTYLYTGTESNQTINNKINLSDSGGLVWIKARAGTTQSHSLVDTARGAGYQMEANSDGAQTYEGTPTFNNNGFNVLGAGGQQNADDADFASWTFRKAPGWYTIKEYTGSGSTLSLTHDLGCVPGMMVVKCTSGTGDWRVFHRSAHSDPQNYGLTLNGNGAVYGVHGDWGNTMPTATHFTVGGNFVGNGATYVAYLFAGGESTQNEAVSVDFDGSNDYLEINDHADFEFGNGDFTIECWVKSTQSLDGRKGLISKWDSSKSWMIRYAYNIEQTNWGFYCSTNGSNAIGVVGQGDIDDGKWHHLAVTRKGDTIRTFTDGKLNNSSTSIGTDSIHDSSDHVSIGRDPSENGYYDGKISNVRVVKGQALYTGDFRIPQAPFTTTSEGATSSNVKLICCNSSSQTGSTVTPGTISNNGSTASTDSGFDDPAGFVFGENKDQGIIKTGSFTGNGSSTGPEINLGWPVQWLLFKNASSTEGWWMFDSMRGIVTGDDDAALYANSDNSESNFDGLELTPTGFKITNSDGAVNGNGHTMIYIAIRAATGTMTRPPELPTGAFAMDTGAGNSTIPNFDSTFPVDMAIWKKPADGSHAWGITTRFTWDNYLPISNAAQISGNGLDLDSNVGWQDLSWADSDYQSWMWKRNAGFTVCTWDGNSVSGRQIVHDMGKIPEMMWVKSRNTSSRNWEVYHKGLNGGTNPEQYYMDLNNAEQNWTSSAFWNNTQPTSTAIHLGNSAAVNGSGETYLGILFASVEGISKCGFYSGSSSSISINTGFAPRFVIIKCASQNKEWVVLDTTRGWGAGTDKELALNNSNAQVDTDLGAPTSTGFTVAAGLGRVNDNGENYIYYAHA